MAKPSSAAESLTVSAAASLGDALTEVVKQWKQSGGTDVRLNIGGSGTLLRQIDEGAAVDVFFPADPTMLEKLETKHRIEPGTRRDLLGNRLVIVVPADASGEVAAVGC